MAPLRSHSQIQSRSGSFTSQSVLVALPGIKWDCVWVQVLDWAAVQGAAVPGGSSHVGQGGRSRVSGCWGSRVALPTALTQAERSFWGLGLRASGAESGCLETLCRPLLAPAASAGPPLEATRQDSATTSAHLGVKTIPKRPS